MSGGGAGRRACDYCRICSDMSETAYFGPNLNSIPKFSCQKNNNQRQGRGIIGETVKSLGNQQQIFLEAQSWTTSLGQPAAVLFWKLRRLSTLDEEVHENLGGSNRRYGHSTSAKQIEEWTMSMCVFRQLRFCGLTAGFVSSIKSLSFGSVDLCKRAVFHRL